MRLILLLLALAACQGPQDTSDRPPRPRPDTDVAEDTDTDVADDTDPPEAVVVQVPCAGAGELGLAVKVLPPEAPRYDDGAPVVLHVPGWSDQGAHVFGESPTGSQRGSVDLYFLLPGGTSGAERSGGIFDDRGPKSMEALACVVEFASGAVRTTEELALVDVAGVPTTELGLMADSNGGNLAIATMAANLDRTAAVKWIAMRETPAGDHYVVPILGLGTRSNPTYTPGSCTPDACVTDESALGIADRTTRVAAALHPAGVQVHLAYYDLDGSGTFDDAGLASDASFDELYKASADLPLLPWIADDPTGEPWAFYPVETAVALEDRFGRVALEAAGIAGAEKSLAFWRWRDPFASGDIVALSAARPDLAVMILATEEDHVQSASDHPHIAIQLAAWTTDWVRLNPDASYLSGSPEVPANEMPVGDALLAALLPESYGDRAIETAAVTELADRVHTGDWAEDLP